VRAAIYGRQALDALCGVLARDQQFRAAVEAVGNGEASANGSLVDREGAWYGEWRLSGQQFKRRIGAKRELAPREDTRTYQRWQNPSGLFRVEAEAELSRLIAASELAARYTPYAGRPRRAMEVLLLQAAAEFARFARYHPSEHALRLAINSIDQPSLWAMEGERPPDGARERGRDTSTFRRGAAMIARYGAGLCVRPEPVDAHGRLCGVEVSRQEMWCDAHVSDSRTVTLRDMRRVLEASADALGV
jgi:hypothetical protein